MDERDFKATLTSVGEQVGSLTHDLKGLLNSIDGGVYLVESGMKKEKPERIEQGLMMMNRNLDRMRRILFNALYYVKDRAVDLQPLNLEEVGEAVNRQLASYAEHLGVTLQVETGNGAFMGDNVAVQAVFTDLLEYAIDACNLAKKSDEPAVAFKAALRDGNLEFEVLSADFVMDEEVRELAKSPHYAPRGADRSHLGLFIARRVAENLGGSMEIAPAHDDSVTSFRGTLPAPAPKE